MFPLAMGVVMASCVLVSNAADLSSRFFWATGRPPLVIEKPRAVIYPESPEFKQLKENEIKRAACRGHIAHCLKEPRKHVSTLKQEFAQDGQLMEESVRLFNAYKKKKEIESLADGVVPKVATMAISYQDYVCQARLRLADHEDTVAKCRARKKPVPLEVHASLTELLVKLNTARMQAPTNWKLYNHINKSMVTEQDVTMFHMQAFKRYMLFDAQFIDLQQAILKNF
ncbi:MAG: hypothetical protein ACHQVS_00095 [Candidatus Babeliales bacterium]